MIVLIDNYDSFTYNLYQLFASYYPDIRVYRNDQVTIEELVQMNPKAIVISPGPCTPMEAGICIKLIQILKEQYPILGVCLGHQAIGAAFEGKVVRADKIVHGKSAMIYHNGSGIFKGMPNPFEAGRYHSLVVERESLPAELEIQAETQDGLIMAMKHRTFPCYGVQFHPESILTPLGATLAKNFLALEVFSQV
ncbi:MAG: aminodeoxychorismate/anthranilate synthase component II [Parachlamydia sp.]|nr:aminodeoxychorismate/anthranilate synthase component II [Parachlamydia sp.]